MPESQEKEKKAKPKERTLLGGFLAMAMSAILSLFIANTMLYVGMKHQEKIDRRERRALIHFLAVEAVDIYAEACGNAYGVFLGNRHREMAAPKMAGARTMGHAMSLDADPALVATVRSIYGRHARVERDLKTAYSFYRARKKFTQNQIGTVITDCTGMGGEVMEVLGIASAEGVEPSAIKKLRGICAGSAKLTVKMVKHKDKLLPDLRLDSTEIDFGNNPEGMSLGLTISNFSDGPVTIKRLTSSLDCVSGRAYLPGEDGRLGERLEVETPEIKPDEAVMYLFDIGSKVVRSMPGGPFEGTVTIETDCPGYELITMPVKGIVEKVKFGNRGSLESLGTLRGKRTRDLYVKNESDKLMTVTRAACSLAGTGVTLPRGNTAKPGNSILVKVEFQAEPLPPGPFEGTLTIETDCPGAERTVIPIKGTVTKE